MTTMATEPALVELRCKCGKLLARVSAVNVDRIKIQIQCPRCNLMYGDIK